MTLEQRTNLVAHKEHSEKARTEGTKQDIVLSESAECEHEPRCQWMDQVYWYRDRSVVVAMNQLHTTKLYNVIQRLWCDH